jgi:L-alanine-DL-glutamate epimerase-like enolase superfamily enzyme
MLLKISNVERILLDVPFRERAGVHMSRRIWRWTLVEICRVTTSDGLVGYGETIVHYTWGRVGDEQVKRVAGGNPADFLWDDSLGAGLQMAIFDLVGKALGVPCYRLMGRKIRDECPISWWAIDMPPDDWAEEVKLAVKKGYCNAKLKARPWFDIFEQVEAVCDATPGYFKLDLDFNSLLLNAGYAVPILRELEEYPKVSMFETPIPQRDVPGYLKIKSMVSRPIALHYGAPEFAVTVMENICDGFVIGGGASQVKAQASAAAEVNMPFWLQLVGTGLTAAFAIHLGAVLTHALWPAITCHEVYSDDLLKDGIQIKGGCARVPDRPGLGVTVDEDAIDRFRVEPPAEKPEPKRRYRISWPDGTSVCFDHANDYYREFEAGNLPVFERGVKFEATSRE